MKTKMRYKNMSQSTQLLLKNKKYKESGQARIEYSPSVFIVHKPLGLE